MSFHQGLFTVMYHFGLNSNHQESPYRVKMITPQAVPAGCQAFGAGVGFTSTIPGKGLNHSSAGNTQSAQNSTLAVPLWLPAQKHHRHCAVKAGGVEQMHPEDEPAGTPVPPCTGTEGHALYAYPRPCLPGAQSGWPGYVFV